MTPTGARELSAFIAGGQLKDSVFRAMVEALPVAIYTTDAEGRLTYFNKAAVKLSGRSPEVGTDQWCVTWKIFLPDGTYLPHDQCPMAVALKGIEAPNGIECMAGRHPLLVFALSGRRAGCRRANYRWHQPADGHHGPQESRDRGQRAVPRCR